METEVRNCLRCKGEKTIFQKGFEFEGKVYSDKTLQCSACKGAGTFEKPNATIIIKTITTNRGCVDDRRKVRAAWQHKLNRYEDKNAARAYYVWRWIQFHSGKDTTLPMMASIATFGDPWEPELQKLSEDICKEAYGNNTAGVAAWARGFGYM